MRKIFLAMIIASSQAMAGGSSGTGTPPLLLDDSLQLMRITLDKLPKAYADEDDLRRAAGRLSVAGTATTDLTVDGATIKVRKLRDSVVDEQIAKEILPQ